MPAPYPNRTDLTTAKSKVKRMVATGQTYGKATEQLRAQREVPLGKSPTQATPRREVKPLSRKTERPDEPITAGAPFGPGPGPQAAGIPMYNPAVAAIEELKFLAQLEQNDDLADLASRWMS